MLQTVDSFAAQSIFKSLFLDSVEDSHSCCNFDKSENIEIGYINIQKHSSIVTKSNNCEQHDASRCASSNCVDNCNLSIPIQYFRDTDSIPSPLSRLAIGFFQKFSLNSISLELPTPPPKTVQYLFV